MGKFDEIKSCFHCRHSGWTLERKLFCAKLQKEVGPIDNNYLSADCPLPDWPSVSREQIRKLTILIQGGDVEWQRTQELIADFVRSVGVEIEEKGTESHLTMLASEEVLKREWDTPEEDKAWEDL